MSNIQPTDQRDPPSRRAADEKPPFYQTTNDDWIKKAIAANPELVATEFAKAIAARGPPEDELLTIDQCCAIVGGGKKISRPTYYRHVKEGRLPKPIHPTRGTSRVRKSELLAALNALRS